MVIYILFLFPLFYFSTAKQKGRVHPTDAEYKSCLFDCPGCGVELPARRWVDPKKSVISRLEVKAPTGELTKASIDIPSDSLIILCILFQTMRTNLMNNVS